MKSVEDCLGTGPQQLFKKCGIFQPSVVCVWDEEGSNPTKINYVGVQPVSEASAHGYSGLALDLHRKFGLIVQVGEEKWIPLDEFEHKRAYIFCDVKTCNNIDKILNDVKNCAPSTAIDEEASCVVEVALHKRIVVPGDWHAGLCMLQAIFNIF